MNQKDFLKKFNISQSVFRKTKLTWEALLKIKSDYESKVFGFNQIANDISARARSLSLKVHSVKFRVKDGEHLIEKIIRKTIENPKRKITISNYEEEITDLVGVRILHLFKEDWVEIDKEIRSSWKTVGKATAYHRMGDSKDYISWYVKAGCKAKVHKYGYRSVHYIVKTSPLKVTSKVEIQVRTLFEEAWSEIDHHVRYPYDLNNKVLLPYLEIFNRMVGTADEMGMFVNLLQKSLGAQESKAENELKRLQTKLSKLMKNVDSNKVVQIERDVAKMARHGSLNIDFKNDFFSLSPNSYQLKAVAGKATNPPSRNDYHKKKNPKKRKK